MIISRFKNISKHFRNVRLKNNPLTASIPQKSQNLIARDGKGPRQKGLISMKRVRFLPNLKIGLLQNIRCVLKVADRSQDKAAELALVHG
ncbi:hypothetical protein NHH03_18440 [Stieleria sp. TO1_6]|nr:hypothetical protein [Stieleria tagensis]